MLQLRSEGDVTVNSLCSDLSYKECVLIAISPFVFAYLAFEPMFSFSVGRR